MKRLQKFVEQGSSGNKPGRAAYAFDLSKLPEPTRGFDWRPVNDFNAADEVLSDANLKPVFEAAIKHGYAVVGPVT